MSDDKGDEAEVIAGAQRALRDNDSRALSRYFEDALDALHSKSVPSESPDTRDREAAEATEQQFRAALVCQVSDLLRPQGISVVRCYDNAERTGYCVLARDTSGRRYIAEFEFSLIDDGGPSEGSVRRLFDRVAEALLKERTRYFLRMQ